MTLIDLTHPFTDNMPVYPGDPAARLHAAASIGKEGYSDHKLETTVHVGTHVDAPAHMIEGGKMIHHLPLEAFCGKGVVMDVRGKKKIDIEIQEYTDIKKGDIVLFCTGFSKRYHEPSYFADYPVMTEAVAHELTTRQVEMVGFDTPSPDRAPYPVHKILLGAGILIIENLTNLEALLAHTTFDIEAFPLALAADAAPARVIARV